MGNALATEIGETVAAGFCNAATPPVISRAFGVASAARSAKGLFTVTLSNEIDPACCVITGNSSTADGSVGCNDAADTDAVKNFHIQVAGADADAPFSFEIRRTRYTP